MVKKLSDQPELKDILIRHICDDVFQNDFDVMIDIIDNIELNSKFLYLFNYQIPSSIHTLLKDEYELDYVGMPVPVNFIPWSIDDDKVRWVYSFLYKDDSIEVFNLDLDLSILNQYRTVEDETD